MPLQNRVDPLGVIHADPARGTLMGNRGIIHDPATKTLLKRRWTTKAWIICLCRFKERHRTPMSKGSYTELFFLDEATALAAGHRPCFECQRERAREFSACFATGNGFAGLRAPEIDDILHGERIAVRRDALPDLPTPRLTTLPDGAVVTEGQRFFALAGGLPMAWRFAGYQRPDPLPDPRRLRLLTPPSTLRALAAGFRPALHPSAFPSGGEVRGETSTRQ